MVQAHHPLLTTLKRLASQPLVFALLLVGCLTTILWPSLEGSNPGNWLVADNFDGYRYVLGQHGIIHLAGDNTGVQSTLATLFGRPLNENSTLANDQAEHGTLQENFAELVQKQGYIGSWLELSDKDKLLEMKTPFVVEVDFPEPHLIIVLDIDNDYIYCADTTVGNVLYPLKDFYRAWAGQVYQFEFPYFSFAQPFFLSSSRSMKLYLLV